MSCRVLKVRVIPSARMAPLIPWVPSDLTARLGLDGRSDQRVPAGPAFPRDLSDRSAPQVRQCLEVRSVPSDQLNLEDRSVTDREAPAYKPGLFELISVQVQPFYSLNLKPAPVISRLSRRTRARDRDVLEAGIAAGVGSAQFPTFRVKS